MQIQVRLEDPDVDALCELREWLQEDQTVRQYGRLRWAHTAGPEQAGIGLDALQVTVGNGLTLLRLAVAIGRWWEARPAAPKVLIGPAIADGQVVSIETADPKLLDGVIMALGDLA